MTDSANPTGGAEPITATTAAPAGVPAPDVTAVYAEPIASTAPAQAGDTISVDGTDIHIAAVITSGPELFALFDQLCPLARQLYGNHSGLYREKLAGE